jgi:phenylacetic acid degradation operon negative regulatory protein
MVSRRRRQYDRNVTDVKQMKSDRPRRGRGPYAALDLSIASTPANSFITDIGVWFVREAGASLAARTWVALLGTLGLSEPRARTAVHRMTKAGYLERIPSGRSARYAMSTAWTDYVSRALEDAVPAGPSSHWTVLTYSIPEGERADRHALRTLLGRRGFAPLGNGVWIASSAALAPTRRALEASGFADRVDIFEAEYRGFDDLSTFVRRHWDIDGIAGMYRRFVQEVYARLARPAQADAQTFADFVLTVNSWRRISFHDPALPANALPGGWPRAEAQAVFDELSARWLTPARAYVAGLENGDEG